MLSPSRAYAEYVRDAARPAGIWTAARRPLFVALIQGAAMTIATTNTIAAPLLVSVTAYWATAVALQVLAALLLIRTGPGFSRHRGAAGPAPRVTTSRAVDLFLLGHAPWSLWLLASAGSMTLVPWLPALRWVSIAGMILPAALTPRIVAAFDQTVLGSSRRVAVRRTILHQGLMWAALATYIVTSIAVWPRLLGLLQ